MEKFLSIIIPVYNVERYLAECLDSCLEQDIPHDDYEIICVNDGSTDGSAAILERYAGENPNIQVITQSNNGLSAARNAGLDAARGEYIWFVDSDDFIRKNSLAQLRRVVTEKPVDKLTFGYYAFGNTLSAAEREQADTGTLQPTTTLRGRIVCDSLYRRIFLNEHNLRFLPELRFAEDGPFQEAFKRCFPLTAYHPAVLYFYRRNLSSLTPTFTPEALRRRRDSTHKVSLIMIGYAQLDLKALQDNQAVHSEYIRILMPEVRHITILAASLSTEHRKEILKKLSDSGLFPLFLYRKPRDWFPKQVHMNHAHLGLKGKLLDVLNFYSTTRLGFAALALYYKLYYKLKKGGHL